MMRDPDIDVIVQYQRRGVADLLVPLLEAPLGRTIQHRDFRRFPHRIARGRNKREQSSAAEPGAND